MAVLRAVAAGAPRRWLRLRAPSPTGVRILSYNVLSPYIMEWHRRLYVETPTRYRRWQTRLPLVVRDIVDQSPDVVCLQEVDYRSMENDLGPALVRQGYQGRYARRTSPHSCDGVAIFFRAPMFQEETRTQRIALDVADGVDNVALAVELRQQRTGTRFTVATTHLLFDPARSDVRMAQLRALLDRLPDAHPIVLTGDFNSDPLSPAIRYLTEGGHRLRFRSLYDDHCNRYSSYVAGSWRLVDYIVYGGGGAGHVDVQPSALLQLPMVLGDPRDARPLHPGPMHGSDHFPLAGDFQFQPVAGGAPLRSSA
ncbi:Endonuclease/exonuclease/phosphatase domain-containing protein [Plasmodiophora brassicae]